MFFMSFSIYSSISAVKNHPSPVWFPVDKIDFTLSAKCHISQVGKYPFLDFASAFLVSFSKESINFIAVPNNTDFNDLSFNNLCEITLFAATYLINPIKSGSTTSAPSFSNKSVTKLFPNG